MLKTSSKAPAIPSALGWIAVAPGVPYFCTEDGRPWHPIGQNDAVSWPELGSLFRRKDLPSVHAYLQTLADHGVTCMRLMLEYAQHRHRYFELSAGVWSPNMVRYWDDLFPLCEQYGIRLLLTPFDTFWMWLKFKHHPYSSQKGGPLQHPSQTLLSSSTRTAIKARLTFAAERWGGSGALFAWDLWNEIHPAQAEESAEPFVEFIQDLSQHVRAIEQHKYGRSHPQTVSLFGPELDYRPHLKMESALFRHPSLDFATIHIYEQGTIDDPRNTVDPAIGMGKVVHKCLTEITDRRPFFDSEHGPIHRFKDRHVTLPAIFDDEYFRHMQWAHLASGGAGGGMRWPNRNPHTLTPGMRRAQHAMALFLSEIHWLRFSSLNASDTLSIMDADGRLVLQKQVARFACASHDQAVVYLLRRDTLLPDGRLDPSASPLVVSVRVPSLREGRAAIVVWDTITGRPLSRFEQDLIHNSPVMLGPLIGDFAVAIRLL